MNEDIDHRLELWMRDVRVSDERVRDLMTIDLPPRRRRLAGWLRVAPAVATAVVAILLVSVALTRLAPGPTGAPRPPDPAAFAGDPRMDRCGATGLGQAIAVFEISHAAEYQIHLPAMGRSPELERPDPALVVIYAGRAPLGGADGAGGASPQPGSTSVANPGPNAHDVCILVGDDPATAEVNVYAAVDTTGLRVDAAP
jgi:hypothetical protein